FAVTTTQANQFFQGNFYANIHTTAFPNGEIRGQLSLVTGILIDLGGNVVGISDTGSGNTGFTAATTQKGTVTNPLNPVLGALGDNTGPVIGAPGNTQTLQTEALLPGSPALGKGVVAGAPSVDERGRARGGDGTVDVGAFEATRLIATGTKLVAT